MNAAARQTNSEPKRSLESLYRRFAEVGLAFLSARCVPAQCVAIHREIWQRIGSRRSRQISDAAAREFLIALAAARCIKIEPPQFEIHAEILRRGLNELEAGAAQLVRLRLANHSYSELGERCGRRAEDVARPFAAFRQRLARSSGVVHWLLAMPDDPCQTAAWLERHLVGARLGNLVAELSVVHGGTANEPAFISALLRGERRTAVLVTGLAALSARRIRALLTHPRLLLELQAIVLALGGPYWDEIRPIDDRLEILADRQWQWVSAA